MEKSPPFLEAVQLAVESVSPINSTQYLFFPQFVGKAVAEKVVAHRPSPLYTNSAMDGFLGVEGGKREVAGEILAGTDPKNLPEYREGKTFYIATGAPVPPWAQFVVPVEKAEEREGGQVILPPMEKGANIRYQGEELEIGAPLLEKGEEITPEKVVPLIYQGIVALKCYKPLSVAILPTGDELAEPFQKGVSSTTLYNTNSYAIYALLEKYNFLPHLLPTLPDKEEEVVKILGESLEKFDAVITIGGASKGRADFIGKAMEKLGVTPIIKSINVKPGKPTRLGIWKGKVLLALPGNIISSYLNALGLGIPVLRKLGGYREPYYTPFYLPNRETFRVNPKKSHTPLGWCDEKGFQIYKNYKYGSGMILPLAKSNCFALIPPGKGKVEKGELLPVVPFNLNFVRFSRNLKA
ncbi:MAG: molybdopterin molybdenumtransferase MoeA [Epsilonproteobacteria bacterium]|nr:molybdopterin molybdenumtransferase MoeA [Campylobacterota bacterium]NPA89515.1 molybdopterin molybdotransferase MoeA [Campylobacterota bacterium]